MEKEKLNLLLEWLYEELQQASQEIKDAKHILPKLIMKAKQMLFCA